MNQDIARGRWKQVRGQVREWWGKLTDDDLDKIAGKSEKLIGKLQVKYGYTRKQAKMEIEKRVAELEVE